MKEKQKAIVWFNEVTKKDIPIVGGKGANLGEMTNAGIPVPPGFIVTAAAYFDFIEKTQLQEKIRSLLEPVDVHDSKRLQAAAAEVQRLVEAAAMPLETAREIEQAYIKMGEGLVAVRSSATAEDLPEASFAGQQETYLNVSGASAGKALHLMKPDQLVEDLKKGEQRLNDHISTKGIKANLFCTLLPALYRIAFLQARLDRNIALLRTVEAIRMFAAEHSGQLPGSLTEITSVPIPADPVTGKDFIFRRIDSQNARLEAPVAPDERKRRPVYELTIKP